MIGTKGTSLTDRILWYDGSSSFEPQALYDLILSGKQLGDNVFTTELTQEIIQFNQLVPDNKIRTKIELDEISTDWIIPDEYKSIDLTKYLLTLLLDEIDKKDSFTKEDIDERLSRITEEIALFDEFGLNEILQAVIYIVDEFRKNDVVWGTGRGSSCCSYCLYLIGLHDVDSVKYNLDLKEFFRR